MKEKAQNGQNNTDSLFPFEEYKAFDVFRKFQAMADLQTWVVL